MLSNGGLKRTVIVELTEDNLRLMGQLLHIYLSDRPNCKNGNSTLNTLIEQTSSVQRNPELHKVFPEAIRAPEKAKKSKSVYYIPYF